MLSSKTVRVAGALLVMAATGLPQAQAAFGSSVPGLPGMPGPQELECRALFNVRDASGLLRPMVAERRSNVASGALGFLNDPSADDRVFYQKLLATRAALEFLNNDMVNYAARYAYSIRNNPGRYGFREVLHMLDYLKRARLLNSTVDTLIAAMERSVGLKKLGVGGAHLYVVPPFNLKSPETIYPVTEELTRKLVEVLKPGVTRCTS